MSAVSIPAIKSFHGTATTSQTPLVISSNYEPMNVSIGNHVYEVIITNVDSTNGLKVAFDDPNAMRDNYLFVAKNSTLVCHPGCKNFIYVEAAASTVEYHVTAIMKNSFNQ